MNQQERTASLNLYLRNDHDSDMQVMVRLPKGLCYVQGVQGVPGECLDRMMGWAVK